MYEFYGKHRPEKCYVFTPQFGIKFAIEVCKCSINLLTGDFKDEICSVIERELFDQFKSHESYLKEELNGNSLYNFEGYNFDRYIPEVYQNDLNYDNTKWHTLSSMVSRTNEREHDCCRRAKRECKALVDRVKQYIDDNLCRQGFQFQCGQFYS